jgi:hypothetical protein
MKKSLKTSNFSDQLKVAQVKPLFKNKNDQLDKTNYRPVSVLPAISNFLSEQFLISSLLSLKTIFIPFCQLFVPIGPVTTGFASLIIFAEIPSKPVAFFIFNLFICLSTKVDVTGLNVKVSVLNFVNKLNKKSVQKYFYEKCAGGPKSSDFWPTIKPFFYLAKE